MRGVQILPAHNDRRTHDAVAKSSVSDQSRVRLLDHGLSHHCLPLVKCAPGAAAERRTMAQAGRQLRATSTAATNIDGNGILGATAPRRRRVPRASRGINRRWVELMLNSQAPATDVTRMPRPVPSQRVYFDFPRATQRGETPRVVMPTRHPPGPSDWKSRPPLIGPCRRECVSVRRNPPP